MKKHHKAPDISRRKRELDTTSLVELVVEEAEKSDHLDDTRLMDALKYTAGGSYQSMPEYAKPVLSDRIRTQLSRINPDDMEGMGVVLVRFQDAVLAYENNDGSIEFRACHSPPVILRQGPYLIVPWTETSLDESLAYQRAMARQQKYFKLKKLRVGDKMLPVVYVNSQCASFNVQRGNSGEVCEIPYGLISKS